MPIATKAAFAIVSVVAVSNLSGCGNKCSPVPGQTTNPLCVGYNVEAGVYKAGDAEIEREILQLEARHELLQSEADRLSGEANRLTGQRKRLAQELAQLNKETAALNRKISDLSKQAELDQQRLAELRRQEKELSRQVLAASETNDAAELARLTARKAELEAEIDELLELA